MSPSWTGSPGLPFPPSIPEIGRPSGAVTCAHAIPVVGSTWFLGVPPDWSDRCRRGPQMEKNSEVEEVRRRLTQEKTRELKRQREDLEARFEAQTRRIRKERDADERRRREEAEMEQVEHEKLMRQRTRQEVMAEAEATMGAEITHLKNQLFEMEEERLKVRPTPAVFSCASLPSLWTSGGWKTCGTGDLLYDSCL